VRVVPNLYPAVERQEVVVHAPHHVRALADLDGGELAAVAAAWTLRAEAARAAGFGYLQTLVNEGAAAGASLGHSHSQLAWFRQQPPVPAQERTDRDDCAVCELVRVERADGSRVLAESEGEHAVVAFCHPAGRLPYEVLVAPVAHAPEPWGFAIEQGLDLVAGVLRRLRHAEGAVPYNALLHCAPFGGDGHWHVELVPRLTILAGLELGAGVYVNTLAPEDAALSLRG
jgi:UDPglucose--hexose-1-phosphate uridylyltransferase